MMTSGLQPLIDSSQLADAGNLAALKQAAAKNSPQALRAAAKQFESLFVSMVLKSVRQANFKDPLFGSDQGNLYQDMYDDQIAAEISKGKGLGLADMLVQQLRREGAGAGPDASSATSAKGLTSPTAGHGSPGAPLASSAARATGASASPAAHTADATTGATASVDSPSACAQSAQQASFARALWPDAQQAARQLGVSPISLLAQAALETNWGRNVPQSAAGGTSNNLFGIKATGWTGPAVASSTQEYSGKAASTVTAQFRAYDSTSQCFGDYVSLLRGNPRYAAALGTGSDVQAFGSALQQGGYATDPAYASKLGAVASTLERALGASINGPAGQAPVAPGAPASSLKLAANLPIASGSGPLPRR
jgi:flagellar protein FlgJ